MGNLTDVAEDTLKGAVLHALVGQARLKEKQIQFIGDVGGNIAAPGGALDIDIEVHVTDDTGARSVCADQQLRDKDAVREVTVRITGGTAPNAALSAGEGSVGTVQAGGTEFVLRLVEGRGSVKVTVTGTGTVDLDLVDSGGSGLEVPDTPTVTFS